MTRRRLSLVGLVVAVHVACAARSAAADDAVEAALRARERVGRVFARPEFDPLAQADRIPVPDMPEVPESAKSWIRAFADTVLDALSFVLKPLGRFLGRILQWLFGGLGKLLGGTGGGAGGEGVPRWAGWLLGALAIGVLAYLVVRLLRSMRAEREARAAAATFATIAEGGEDDALAQSPEDWRRDARELAAGGARRDALRALYLALLASLHRVGAIRYDRTRTNTAYVFDLDRAHPARAPFASITRRFDAAWYGGYEPGPGDIGSATEEADLVLRAFREEAAVA